MYGLHCVYDDDCGAWLSSAGHTTKIPYIVWPIGAVAVFTYTVNWYLNPPAKSIAAVNTATPARRID